MLNKNDPLIGAVQQVMQRNNAEREAVKVVNEYFGVTDRKALPHERQSEWNAAYQQVLSESNIKHPNQQKLDVHEPEKDELTAQDFKMLRAKKKPMEEAKTNPYAIGMAAVKKSTGDEPPMEKKNIKKAHEIAKKIIKKKMNEGFNNRHSLSENASVEEQAVAVLNEEDIDSYESRMTAGLGQSWSPYGGNRFSGGVGAKTGTLARRPVRVDTPNINTRTGEKLKPQSGSSVVPKIKASGPRGRAPVKGPWGKRDRSSNIRGSGTQSNNVPPVNRSGQGSAISGNNPPTMNRGSVAGTFTSRIQNQARTIRSSGTQTSGVPAISRSGQGSAITNKPGQGQRSASIAGTFRQNLVAARNRKNMAQQSQTSRVGGNTVAANQAARNRQSSQALGGFKNTGNATNTLRAQRSSRALGGFGKIGVGAAMATAGASAVGNSPPPASASGSEKIKTTTQTTSEPKVYTGKFGDAFKQARKDAEAAGSKSTGKFKYKDASGKVKEFQTNIKGSGTASKPQEKYVAPSKQKDVTPTTTRTSTSVVGGQGIAALPGGPARPAATTSAPPSPLGSKQASTGLQIGGARPEKVGNNRPAAPLSGATKMTNPTQRPYNASTSPDRNSITRRVSGDGSGGLKVSDKPSMGMSFTPKTNQAAAQEPAKSVTPQMNQTRSDLEAKASMAGNERGLAPNMARNEIKRRENIQTAKGA